MKSKILSCICTAIAIVLNILMATVINNGESITGNIFIIVITIIMFFLFIISVKEKKARAILVTEIFLLGITAISLINLFGKIDSLAIIAQTVIYICILAIFIGMAVILIKSSRNKNIQQ